MSMPVRIQRKRSKGWRMPEGAVYVGRPTKWGNPFVGDGAVALFRMNLLLRTRLGLLNPVELQGKDLACWCSLDVACHADVLLEMANAID